MAFNRELGVSRVKSDRAFINKAAQQGGQAALKYFNILLRVEEKATPSDLRTQADTASEKAVLAVLKKRFPTYNILSEESGFYDRGSEYTFLVDPLDGTNNFTLGLPDFTTSIGLIKNGTLQYGVVYVPVLGRTYYATKGEGAFCNGERLKVSNEKRLNRGVVSYIPDYLTPLDDILHVYVALRRIRPKRVLSSWSPAHDFCLLATGRIHGIIFDGAQTYDFAAGKIIAREAGAIFSDFNGKKNPNDESNHFITSNCPSIEKELLKIMKKEKK